jgi:hypothetical protein
MMFADLSSGVTPTMLCEGYLSLAKGIDGVPFQELAPGVTNYWHPGTNPAKQTGIVPFDGLIAAEMRRRVELGHGTWPEIAVMYGCKATLSDSIYPFCSADKRKELVCQRLAVPLADAVRAWLAGDTDDTMWAIMEVIDEKVWYFDYAKRDAAES